MTTPSNGNEGFRLLDEFVRQAIPDPSLEDSGSPTPVARYRHLASRTEQGVLVLTLTDPQVRGDDLADELRTELLAAAGEADRVVLDLHNVVYMSSVAFRPLLLLQRTLKPRGGRIVLCHLAEPVKDVLHQTRMISTSGSSHAPFEEQPDVAAAVASLAPKT